MEFDACWEKHIDRENLIHIHTFDCDHIFISHEQHETSKISFKSTGIPKQLILSRHLIPKLTEFNAYWEKHIDR
jgi:hypothetical protein